MEKDRILGRLNEPINPEQCPDCEKRIIDRFGSVHCARCIFNPAQPSELRAKQKLIEERDEACAVAKIFRNKNHELIRELAELKKTAGR